MKNKIIDQLTQGNTEEAIDEVEALLGALKDEYFKWAALKARYNKLKGENIKGIVSQAEFSVETNKINALVMEHFRDLEVLIGDYFSQSEKFSLSPEGFKDRLQNKLMEQYQLLETIGGDDSTIFYKAQQWMGDRVVAIKALISQNLTHDSNAFTEVDKVKYLKHRNIRTIVDDARSKEYPKYVILEYIDGTDLRSIIENTGPRTVFETKRILKKICDALYYLHKRKNFTSDLRPSRVMMDEEGEPILTLFTGFKARGDSNYFEILSDFQYMSPERLNAKHGILEDNIQSNQFALGVLAYFLVTGQHLFFGDSLTDVIEQRQQFLTDSKFRENKFEQLRGPDEFKSIIKQLLNPTRKERFKNIKAVIKALDNCKVLSKAHYEIARESYQRCTALNPAFISQFLDRLMEALPVAKTRIGSEKVNRKRLEIMLHNSINIMIETNVDDSYMDRIRNIKGHKGLTKEDYTGFFELFKALVKENDYMWSTEIEKAWTLTLQESVDDLTQ